MNALFLTLFVSAVLVIGALLLYSFLFAQRSHEHTSRLSLLPLDDDGAQTAPAPKEGTP
jgi:hypothetical protein